MTQYEQKLYRLPDEAAIAGVASGFARYFAMDVTLMRLIFIATAMVTNGVAVAVYIVLALIMPTPGKDDSRGLSGRVEHFAEEVKDSGRIQHLSNYIGIGLIVFGIWLLLGQLFPEFFRLQWSLLWPSLVILVGLLIVVRSKHRE